MDKTTSRKKEQLGGLLLAILGASMTGINWYWAIYKFYYYSKPALLGPSVMSIGIGLILFPSYKRERLDRKEAISALSKYQLVTVRWWTILAIGFICGGINLYLHKSF